MRNLRPAESLAMAFVIGAGLGSVCHMVFMLSLLLVRRIRCGRMSKRAPEAEANQAEPRVEAELPGYEEDASMAARLAQDKA
jgi:hypothetical protein